MRRLLLLMATRTYRARAFIAAARKLGGEVVIGTDREPALAHLTPGASLCLDLTRPAEALLTIERYASERPLDAIVGVDDDTTLVAAMATRALGLPGNSVESVRAAQNKHAMRALLAAAGLRSPHFELVALGEDPAAVAARTRFPVVLKPLFLAASRGVIRADSEREFVDAFRRIGAILQEPEVQARGGELAGHLLVESFIPGAEVAVEGLLSNGALQVLALFDKPDPLDGPFFEETIYRVPSCLPDRVQEQIAETTGQAARALGLREGPVHAELRVDAEGVTMVEIAARSIGGLCSSALEFSGGFSLEDLILRHALGADTAAFHRILEPAGAMMIPIPAAGVLAEVRGKDRAEAVEGVEGVAITIPIGERVVPLPEGDRYLGFIFARGRTPAAVDAALRNAHARLEFVIA